MVRSTRPPGNSGGGGGKGCARRNSASASSSSALAPDERTTRLRDGVIALAGIPFAVSGGILGLYVAGLNASVSAAVGFISLFGVSAMDGILLMSYIRRALEDGMGTEQAIISAGNSRMRQVFMTGFSPCIGLLPAAISTGIGSQVQQPLACVIVGGTLLSPICSLLRLLMPTIEGIDVGRGSYAAEG